MSEITTDTLIYEGQQIKIVLQKSGSTIQLTWAYPANMLATTGCLILISERPLNPSNRPTDTALYAASNDLALPAYTIGTNAEAQVVGAFYDDISTKTISITNVDPAKLYYASIHACSNVRQYYANGTLSYPLDAHIRSSANPENASGDIPTSETIPLNPTIGQVYYSISSNAVSMWNGAIWMPAGTGTVGVGAVFPLTPITGQFFYNTVTGDLDIWNGVTWSKANTANEGVPMYSKQGVGTDGTSDERADLVNTLKLMMGYPKICVELDDGHFQMAIDDALGEFRHRADNAYTKNYMLFKMIKNQQTYYLNDPVLGSNRVVDVTRVNRIAAMGSYQGNDSGIYNQTFLNQLRDTGSIDLTSIHLMANLSKEVERIFAGNIMFTWHESSRVLRLERKISRDETVILECIMERTEQDLIVDRWTKSWIKNWSHARLMEILGNIRSKFSSLAGPGGGISLNGNEMLSRADAKYEELRMQIQNYEAGNGGSDLGFALLCG